MDLKKLNEKNAGQRKKIVVSGSKSMVFPEKEVMEIDKIPLP